MCVCCCFFFQAEDGIRDLVRSRGLGDVYKRQGDTLGRQGLRVVAHHREDGEAKRLASVNVSALPHLSLIHI